MKWNDYKIWLRTKEGGENTLAPDGVKFVPTIGYGYAFGRFENGRFKGHDITKINSDLNYAKNTENFSYVTAEAFKALEGATPDQIKLMAMNGELERMAPRLNDDEMARLQQISILEKQNEAAFVMHEAGINFDALSVEQQIVLTDLRYRGGNKLLSKDSELSKAIARGDMGRAYFEIAYGSNREKAAGNDIRMAVMADEFYRSLTPEQQAQVDNTIERLRLEKGSEATLMTETDRRNQRNAENFRKQGVLTMDKAREKVKGEQAARGKTSSFEFPASGGEVAVHGYNRGNGEVQAHERSRPDDDLTNNLGYRRKV